MRVELVVTGRDAEELLHGVRVQLAALNAPERVWVFERLDVSAVEGTPKGEVPAMWEAEATLWDGQDELPLLE